MTSSRPSDTASGPPPAGAAVFFEMKNGNRMKFMVYRSSYAAEPDFAHGPLFAGIWSAIAERARRDGTAAGEELTLEAGDPLITLIGERMRDYPMNPKVKSGFLAASRFSIRLLS